jgi:hypothetical protein
VRDYEQFFSPPPPKPKEDRIFLYCVLLLSFEPGTNPALTGKLCVLPGPGPAVRPNRPDAQGPRVRPGPVQTSTSWSLVSSVLIICDKRFAVTLMARFFVLKKTCNNKEAFFL